MGKVEKFIRIITDDNNEVVLALDSILSVERHESSGIITMKNNAVYKVKIFNRVLELIEKHIDKL